MIKYIALLVILIAHPMNLSANESEPSFDISNYSGKVVYLDFWASWCVPCRRSFPWMNEMRQKYSSDQLVIVAVNLDKDASLAADFLKNYPADFDIIYDPQGELAKKYQIPGMPSSILFNQNGQVIEAHGGFFQKKIAEYEQQIEQAINSLKD